MQASTCIHCIKFIVTLIVICFFAVFDPGVFDAVISVDVLLVCSRMQCVWCWLMSDMCCMSLQRCCMKCTFCVLTAEWPYIGMQYVKRINVEAQHNAVPYIAIQCVFGFIDVIPTLPSSWASHFPPEWQQAGPCHQEISATRPLVVDNPTRSETSLDVQPIKSKRTQLGFSPQSNPHDIDLTINQPSSQSQFPSGFYDIIQFIRLRLITND